MDSNKKCQILFIDDDRDTCYMLSALLEIEGYLVIIASDISQGIKLARKRKFDLILLDWYLEGGTGIDVCRQIRSFDEHTPIFFYTDIADPEALKTALETGAQGYFIKPVDSAALLRVLKTRMAGSESKNELPPM